MYLLQEDNFIFKHFKNYYSFKTAKKEWQKIPLDDIGYFDSKELLKLNDSEFLKLMNQARDNRYNLNGYRNFNNLWRVYSKNNELTNKVVFDYGTGSGIEALEFAKNGNEVIIGDINDYNLQVATRLLNLNSFQPLETLKLTHRFPYFKIKNKIDVFYANGVLHHTPKIRSILNHAKNVMRNDTSEAILMLYSDLGYKKYIDQNLPNIKDKIIKNPNFKKMYSHFDSVGKYADWYSKDKILLLIKDDWNLVSFNYATNDNRFAFINLRPK